MGGEGDNNNNLFQIKALDININNSIDDKIQHRNEGAHGPDWHIFSSIKKNGREPSCSPPLKIIRPRGEVKIFFSIYLRFMVVKMTARIKLRQCKKKEKKIC